MLAASPCPGLSAGANQVVRLVDEQDIGDGGGFHRVDDAMQPALELAFHARACLQQAEVKRKQSNRL